MNPGRFPLIDVVSASAVATMAIILEYVLAQNRQA